VKRFLLKKIDYVCLLLIFLYIPLFFYKLGQSSLVSWDEAWYAEIARNILRSGDIFNLTWSGEPYFDHPAGGFWFIALAFRLFGISEFWARFTPALAGLLSLGIIYLLGKELFGRVVGFASAIALPSSFWFLYRSRSGNLDIFLTLFFLLTLFLALKAAKNKKYLIPFSLSLSFLFLTKTLVPLTIIPPLFIIFWRSKSIALRNLVLPILIVVVLVGGWTFSQLQHKDFIDRYFQVGLPGMDAQSNLKANVLQAKVLLHNGVGKWFWLGIGSLAIGVLARQKRFLILAAFFVSFVTPFAFSQRSGIWHLIPLHPILILSFLGLLYVILEKIMGVFSRNKAWVALPIILLSIYISYPQIKRSWYEFINVNPYTSDEEVLAREAGNYPQKLFIASSDFRPAAVFYSGKNVPQMILGIKLPDMFKNKEEFLLIVQENDLAQPGISKDSYEILQKDRDKILLLKK